MVHLFCGVDSHKDTLAACLVDQTGRRLAAASVPNTPAGYRRLAGWLTEHGPVTRVGIEGSANLGAALASFLYDQGVDVREVPGALTVRERRRLRRPGKSDPTDALAIARICARDPEHGGSQGFKSPHLHPHKALVTGLAGRFRLAGALFGSPTGQQTGSNRDETANRYSIAATRRSEADTYSAFRLRDGCSASIWTGPEGSSLLTLDGPSIQTAPDGYSRIVWMIKRMIKGHPTHNRMARQADSTETLLELNPPGDGEDRYCAWMVALGQPTAAPSHPAAQPGRFDVGHCDRIEGASHWMVLDRPEQVNELLLDWLTTA